MLLLNTCLTVRRSQANSHAQKGWEKLTQKVIDVVNKKRTKGVVFLAWGTPAKKRVEAVNKEVHCILQSVHPSPLSAERGFVSLALFLSLFPPFPLLFLFYSLWPFSSDQGESGLGQIKGKEGKTTCFSG